MTLVENADFSLNVVIFSVIFRKFKMTVYTGADNWFMTIIGYLRYAKGCRPRGRPASHDRAFMSYIMECKGKECLLNI